MNQPELIDYPGFIDEAMRGVVRKALRQVAESGLPGDHHFYISFATEHPGVRVSPALKTRYPKEMTIVIQFQFWDLTVEDEGFSVTLSFNNVPEKLVVPFAALIAFADPSVKFGLQFHAAPSEDAPPPPHADNEEPEASSAEVISLDAFRKK